MVIYKESDPKTGKEYVRFAGFGRLTQDIPTSVSTKGETSYVNGFSLVIDEWSAQEKKRVPRFFGLAAFGKTAESLVKRAQKLGIGKGSQIYVEGTYSTSVYNNKKRENVSIFNVEFALAKGAAQSENTGNSSSGSDYEQVADDDELPF